MKIKVIDLLNKIANGEEVPKYISYFNIYSNEREKMYVCETNIIEKLSNGDMCSVKDEVEIIEEDKEIEELNLDADALKGDEIVRTIDYLLESKINSLVKAVNELKKGK